MNKKSILFLMAAMIMTGCSPSSVNKDGMNPTAQTSESERSTEDKTTIHPQTAPIRSIRLDVPQILQETNYYCGVACLQMVLAYHGIEESQDVLAAALHTHPVTGTEYEDLAREASTYIFGRVPEDDSQPGYRAFKWNRNQGTEQTKEQFFSRTNTDLRSEDPVFISLNPSMVYEEGADAVHILVLYGADFDEEGSATHYYCIDPYGKYQDAIYGGKKVFTADELWNAMNNNPEPGYVW